MLRSQKENHQLFVGVSSPSDASGKRGLGARPEDKDKEAEGRGIDQAKPQDGRSQMAPQPRTPRQSSRLAAKSQMLAASSGARSELDGLSITGLKRKRGVSFLALESAPLQRARSFKRRGPSGREETEGRLDDDMADMRKEDGKDHDKYCHFCQHAKKNMLACECSGCTHRFCLYCLNVHLGDDTDHSTSNAWDSGAWRCPTCRKGCCCSKLDCTRAHRHCKAFRYRCRRADAANRRQTAAHALVWLAASSDDDTTRAGSCEHKAKASTSPAVRSNNQKTIRTPANGTAVAPQDDERSVHRFVSAAGGSEMLVATEDGGAQDVGESSSDVGESSHAEDHEEQAEGSKCGFSGSTFGKIAPSSSEGAALQALASLFFSASAQLDTNDDSIAAFADDEENSDAAERSIMGVDSGEDYSVDHGVVIPQEHHESPAVQEGEKHADSGSGVRLSEEAALTHAASTLLPCLVRS